METDKTIETSKEGLDIITQMIRKTQVNIEQGSFHLLLWGWIIAAGSLGHFVLMKFTSLQHPELAWLIIAPGIIISMTYGFIKGSRARVYTYADYVYMWIWLGFFFTAIVMVIFVFNQWQLIGPMFLMLAGYATFMSGIVIKFRPLIVGGVLFWLFALLGFFIENEFSLLVSTVAVVGGYLIPGYILKRKFKNEQL